jgi:hypothetical protein
MSFAGCRKDGCTGNRLSREVEPPALPQVIRPVGQNRHSQAAVEQGVEKGRDGLTAVVQQVERLLRVGFLQAGLLVNEGGVQPAAGQLRLDVDVILHPFQVNLLPVNPLLLLAHQRGPVGAHGRFLAGHLQVNDVVSGVVQNHGRRMDAHAPDQLQCFHLIANPQLAPKNFLLTAVVAARPGLVGFKPFRFSLVAQATERGCHRRSLPKGCAPRLTT